MAFFLGILSGLIMAVGHLSYVMGIRSGATVPNKMFWMIVFFNSCVIIANQIASDVNESIWGMSIPVVTIGIVMFYALRFGVTEFNKIDFVVAGLAAAGIMGWLITEDPFVSILLSAAAGIVSVVPIFNKLRTLPGTEDTRAWILAMLSMIVMCFAVEPEIDFLLLPGMWVCLNASVAAVNISQKRLAVNVLTNS